MSLHAPRILSVGSVSSVGGRDTRTKVEAWHVVPLGLVLLSWGLVLHFVGVVDYNASLWSPSYALVHAGADMLLFLLCTALVTGAGWNAKGRNIHNNESSGNPRSNSRNATSSSGRGRGGSSRSRGGGGGGGGGSLAGPSFSLRVLRLVLWPLVALGSHSLLVFLLSESGASLDVVASWPYLHALPSHNIVALLRGSHALDVYASPARAAAWACIKASFWMACATLLTHVGYRFRV